MTRYLLIFILGVVFYYPGSAVETQRLVVLFDSDKHELTEIAQNALYDFISEIDPGSDFELEIMGHTDDIGNLSYNDALSEKRSLAVREYLLKAGIESKLIRTYSFGERKPEKPNIDDTHRNMNRRVELVLTNYSFKDLSELEKTLSREGSNYFTLDPSEPAIIKGREGVSMLIEANSFVNKQGETVKEPVKVTLTEALNFEDYIGHNLTTLSGDRMLVSGGMLQVTAQTANGDTLNLAPGKAITTAVTVPRTEEGMQLFTSNTGSSWDISETRVTSGLELDLPPYPRFNFRSYSLPIYNRDFSSKPEKPEFRGQPKPPKAPDPLDYEPEIEWYQFLFAEKIKREAHERYMGVMQKHEEKVTFYHRRYELYEEHNSDMPEKLARYKKDLIAWDKQCKEDSISFLSSTEYLELKNKNLLLLSQAREKYDEEVKEWEQLKREKMGELAEKMDSMGVTSQEVMNTYMFTMNEMSWINIDRFYKMDPTDLRAVTLLDVDETEEKVFVVFRNLNSMLPMEKKHEGSAFYKRDRFPLKEKAGLMAYKVVDGKAMVYYEDLSPKRTNYKMEYRPYTFRELHQLLTRLQGRS